MGNEYQEQSSLTGVAESKKPSRQPEQPSMMPALAAGSAGVLSLFAANPTLGSAVQSMADFCGIQELSVDITAFAVSSPLIKEDVEVDDVEDDDVEAVEDKRSFPIPSLVELGLLPPAPVRPTKASSTDPVPLTDVQKETFMPFVQKETQAAVRARSRVDSAQELIQLHANGQGKSSKARSVAGPLVKKITPVLLTCALLPKSHPLRATFHTEISNLGGKDFIQAIGAHDKKVKSALEVVFEHKSAGFSTLAHAQNFTLPTVDEATAMLNRAQRAFTRSRRAEALMAMPAKTRLDCTFDLKHLFSHSDELFFPQVLATWYRFTIMMELGLPLHLANRVSADHPLHKAIKAELESLGGEPLVESLLAQEGQMTAHRNDLSTFWYGKGKGPRFDARIAEEIVVGMLGGDPKETENGEFHSRIMDLLKHFMPKDQMHKYFL